MLVVLLVLVVSSSLATAQIISSADELKSSMDSYFLSKLQNRDEMFLKRLSKKFVSIVDSSTLRPPKPYSLNDHIRPGLHIGEMVHHSKPSRRFRKRGYRRFLRRRMRVAGDANVGRSEGWSGTRAFDSVPSLSPRDLQRTTIPTPVHKMPWMMPLKKKRPAVGSETLLGEDYSP